MIPTLTHVNDLAFLADDTLIGGYELGGGWLRVERVKIGKRAFVGNSGHGRTRPQGAEAGAGRRAVRRAAPEDRAGPGESWLGSPPSALRRTAQARHAGPHLRPADPAQGGPSAVGAGPDRAGRALGRPVRRGRAC